MVAQRIAIERGSKLLQNLTLQNLNCSFTSFQRIRRNILDLTSDLRQQDCRAQRALFLQQNSNNNNIPRPKRNAKAKLPSYSKRQILIADAFKRSADQLARQGQLM